MTQDPATPSSPVKPKDNEPSASVSPEAAADPAAVAHYNPHLALTPPPKENTFTGKLKDAGSWMKDYGTALKHGSIKPYPLTERKTRAATRNQAWGPIGQELNELAALSYNPNDCSIIFRVLELRLDYPPDKWRNVYKALSVIEFLVKRGSEDAVVRAKGFINRLEFLESFAYITPDSRDVGGNVRHRARAIRALLEDEKRLKEERTAAASQQSRMVGGKAMGGGEQQRGDDRDTTESVNKDGVSPVDGDQINRETTATTPVVNSSAPGALPNAGETKGVSIEENARHLAALKKILARPENALCADCGVPGAGHRPTWASISLGVFMCMRCAGVHRGLGVHVSQVRSVSLDSWLAPQVEFMASCGGNLRANQYWEARLPDGKKPSVATLADLDMFLRRKYTDKEFVDNDGVWPPTHEEVEYSIMDAELKRILEEMLPEHEREAAVAAREAAEAAAAAKRKLEEEEAAARKAAEEEIAAEKARMEAVKAAEAQVDLINLLDLDLGDGSQSTVAATTSNGQGTNSDSGGAKIARGAVDPFAALESIFVASTTEAEDKDKAQKDPLYVSQPPATIDAWDMGAVLAAQQAQQAKEEAQRAREAEEQAAAAAAAEAAAQQQAAYRPPWAPSASPLPLSGRTAAGSTGSSSASPLGAVPALLTAGPAAAFQDGFLGVPHQFTSTPVVPQGHVAHQYGWAQAPSPTNTSSNPTKAQPIAPQRPLQPHELRAQQLMLNGLDSFNAHASLVAVKPQSSPSTSGMGAFSPGSTNGGISPPLKSFTKSPPSKSPSPSARQ